MMKTAAILTLCFSIACVHSQVLEQCRIAAYPGKANDVIPTEILNLDLPPLERWTNIVTPRKGKILHFVNYVKHLLPFGVFKYLSEALASGINKIPYPYNDEIIGIAKALDLPLGDILACNIFYELEKMCTSIILRDPEGYVYHARNMDLGAWMGWDTKNNTWKLAELLRPITVNVEFQSKGQTLYKTVQFAGTVGVFTGVKSGKFSFSLNSRSAEHFFGGPMSVVEWLLVPRSKYQFASLWAREVFDKAESYHEAKTMLSTKPIWAPVYYILAGVNQYEGIVITRSKTSSTHPMILNEKMWYLVQTNYDNWKTPPFYDDRRKPAKMCLKQLRNASNKLRENSLQILFNILSTVPVENKATIYTALMSPRNGHLESYKRSCKGICYPW